MIFSRNLAQVDSGSGQLTIKKPNNACYVSLLTRALLSEAIQNNFITNHT